MKEPIKCKDGPDCILPEGVYRRLGYGGSGVQLYRIQGSCLGDVEFPIGFGPTLEAAIADAQKRKLW